jgi:hypothetical protein
MNAITAIREKSTKKPDQTVVAAIGHASPA